MAKRFFVPKAAAPAQYVVLKEASDCIDRGEFRSAYDRIKQQAVIKSVPSFNAPLVACLKAWFGADRAPAFKELSACVHSTGGELRDQLAAVFKELAVRWYKVSPSEAITAVQSAQGEVTSDKSALALRETDMMPRHGYISQADVQKAAESVFLYQLARETLVIMRSSERPKTGHAMSVDDFMQRHGYGN